MRRRPTTDDRRTQVQLYTGEMKNAGRCPKCGGREIGNIASELAYDDDAIARVRSRIARIEARLANRLEVAVLDSAFATLDRQRAKLATLLNAIRIDRYVCMACGFSEEYLADPKRARELAPQRWTIAGESPGGVYR